MTKNSKPGSYLEPDYKPEAMASKDPQLTLKVKQALIVIAVLLSLVAGSAPAADAATSRGDTSIQTQRVCWFRC